MCEAKVKEVRVMRSSIRLWAYLSAVSMLALSLLALSGANALPTSAHGKEVTIEVSSFAPDGKEPLVRLYRAFVVYAGDKEPVAGARIELTAARKEGGPGITPVTFQPLRDVGTYVAEVKYPHYGSWNVTLRVEEQGEGQTSFVEQVAPVPLAQAPGAVSETARREVLNLFFRFDWRDVANIAVRTAHVLAASVWFGLTGIILVGYFFLGTAPRSLLLRRIEPAFAPAAAVSLGLLGASGVYNGIFSSPIRPPGVFAVATMAQIPFGVPYLVAFGVKLVAFGAGCALAMMMVRALKVESRLPVVSGGAVAVADAWAIPAPAGWASLRRLALINAVLGLVMVVDVVVTVYLHYISHLAVALPG